MDISQQQLSETINKPFIMQGQEQCEVMTDQGQCRQPGNPCYYHAKIKTGLYPGHKILRYVKEGTK